MKGDGRMLRERLMKGIMMGDGELGGWLNKMINEDKLKNECLLFQLIPFAGNDLNSRMRNFR